MPLIPQGSLIPDPIIFERWLVGALETYPDEAIRAGTNVQVDAFDVVNKLDFPSLDSLRGANGYDVVMLSGSSQSASRAS